MFIVADLVSLILHWKSKRELRFLFQHIIKKVLSLERDKNDNIIHYKVMLCVITRNNRDYFFSVVCEVKKQYSIYFKNENNVGHAFVLLFIKLENVCS